MKITVEIPWILRPCCNGASELSISATTIGDALTEIERLHPDLYRSVCDETGTVRRHVHLFVNSSLLGGSGQLDTKLDSGDVVHIFQAVSGG